jgi:hypothetical protein
LKNIPNLQFLIFGLTTCYTEFKYQISDQDLGHIYSLSNNLNMPKTKKVTTNNSYSKR